MNLVEASRSSLIVELPGNRYEPFDRQRWRLVIADKPGGIILSKENFTSEETQNLIDLLERVQHQSKMH